MNREIKFRAYDTAKKEWLFGYEMPHLGGFSLFGEIMLMGEWAATIDAYIFERDGHKQDDLKVMQFTKLKDCKGKEIYEGDLLQSLPDGTMPREIFEVFWDNEMSGWMQKDVRTGCHFMPLEETYKVIGNIYENPELLKP